ncbi:MAG TPA: DNA mismatch repair protein MutS [Terriglobales bacterium]|nr:DNA mismatch repair protein MutS [Terriglobales bacterium]
MPAEPPSVQTPLMRQYSEAKRQHPEALLLFRLGDFYELFYEDAVTAARALQITLTSRNKERGAPIPMCGVPYHAAEGYIAKLIQQGYKVALCDQMEDPRQAKTLVRREVTRVLTPGTAALAQAAGENTYLAAVARAEGKGAGGGLGLAVLDVSTGEFRATEFSGEAAEARLAEELARWRPRELLYAAAAGDAPLFRGPRPEELATAVLTPLEAWMLEPGFAQGVLESHFGVLSLEGFGLAGKPWAQAAAGAIVHYVKETQRSQLAHVDRLGYYERQQGLVLDAVTARNLELVEPLFQGAEAATVRAVLDATVTPMGKRLLRQWLLRPSGELAEIQARQEAVAALVEDWGLRQKLRAAAAGVQDLERLLGRVALATALPRDLLALAASLDRVPELGGLLGGAAAGRWGEIAARLDPCDELRQAIGAHLVESPPATLAEGGYIRPGVSAELDELRSLSHNAKGAVAAIEARERARTGIGSLKVRFNQVFGYYLEVSKANLRHVPADYERKQTLANAERFTTPELKELEAKILSADERSRELEQSLFLALRARAGEQAGPIRRNAEALAELDLLANFAHLAAEQNYCRPEVGAEGFDIRDGRHPVVERLGWEASADRFVPNDLYLDRERQRVLLITGPNMGGKSTYLRQAALIAILAQMGSFVPARSARVPLLDRIFTRIGASDNLARGRSTFMVEMTEAAVILNQSGPRSLVILDEIGRGTATYDGLALAWAMVEYLHQRSGAFTLFATHYHELTELARHLEAVQNVHVAAQESPQGIVFLRKVEAGEASRSYGIEVARLAGLPREVLQRAREVLRQHEQAETRTSSQLEAPAEARLQLALFTPLSQQVADRVAAAELERLTPLEALNLLAELQKSLRGGE